MEKQFRIKRNEEIGEIVKLKQRVYSDNLIIYYRKKDGNLRLAISVSKKYGDAVERNYAKRLIREASRMVIHKYSNLDLIIVVRNDLRKVDFQELIQEMDKSLIKINQRLDNNVLSIKEEKWKTESLLEY